MEEQLSNLIGLSCVVARDFRGEKDGVSFSIRGTLECKTLFYRLSVSTVSFVSFTLEDVKSVEDRRITLK